MTETEGVETPQSDVSAPRARWKKQRNEDRQRGNEHLFMSKRRKEKTSVCVQNICKAEGD